MYRTYEKRIAALLNCSNSGTIKHGLIGLEKETLRVGADGKIAQTPHPQALGAALTHPYITTDYSEALTELITPPFANSAESLGFLRDTQAFVYTHLGEEILWATSMPCVVAGETSIPIAQYGHSNPGIMKTVYRRGLGHRYGRTMQVIAGVHFNYSVPEQFWPVYQQLEQNQTPLNEFTAQKYFELIRNLLRFGWLIPYLFGASPAVCKSFLAGKETFLDSFNDNTFYEPYATSLRMGDIGYQNNKEKAIGVRANYDSLQQYVASLSAAISTPYSGYEKFGTVVNGEYQQLNTNILQIENEYYSTVRPKQILNGNEKPTLALKKRGVRYIELRSLDVNAFDPLGIDQTQACFLEIFMLFCLLHESPAFNTDEQVAIDQNELLTAHQGRKPDCHLNANGRQRPLREWAAELCQQMRAVAELLDKDSEDKVYARALAKQLDKVADPEVTPSATMLRTMRENKEGFFDFALRMSNQHQGYFRQVELSQSVQQQFQAWARESLEKQKDMESSEQLSFADYLAAYFAQS